jgi:hypothetical protein
LDPASQAGFDALRTAHFPPDRLVVGAHVTLFHALPSDLDVVGAVRAEAEAVAPFSVSVAEVRLLGRGVAFGLRSGALMDLRGRLRGLWVDRLTAQDRQGWRPHVTIQNKADPVVARALYDKVARSFVPYDVSAVGLAVWVYWGGPWEAAGGFRFGL